ncbi:MAG: hypothetical protein L6Q76_37090, partial [Polyangiaceae bacterium]|nr:hypothetical protein [Polyangiaceae bacterium]
MVGNAPLYRYSVGDELGERLAAAMISDAKAAPIGAVQQAFGMDDATLWRVRERLRTGGVAALVPKKRGRKPQDLEGPLARRVLELRKQNVPLEEIARRLSVSVYRVRRVIAKSTLPAASGAETLPLPLAEAEGHGEPAAPADASANGALKTDPAAPDASPAVSGNASAAEIAGGGQAAVDATPRATAALDAALGLVPEGEAEPVFEDRSVVANAGVLLAVPALEATGVLESSREVYGRLRRGVYGLRATVILLAFLALVRRPRPEALKTIDPRGLGDLLGLARAPEVKTVRRKLAEIAERGKAHEFMRSLGKRWLADGKDSLGVLYVDGHVRVYDGKHKLPKAHVTQKNLCMPATVDYWVNDVNGSPVFVVTPPANAAMTKVLPGLVPELEALGGGRKGMIVFDRGGWSPKMFASLIRSGWHILTYRKGKRRKHARAAFKHHKATIDGRVVEHDLSERRVRISNVPLREIAELRDDGGQTILVTSDLETPAL